MAVIATIISSCLTAIFVGLILLNHILGLIIKHTKNAKTKKLILGWEAEIKELENDIEDLKKLGSTVEIEQLKIKKTKAINDIKNQIIAKESGK